MCKGPPIPNALGPKAWGCLLYTICVVFQVNSVLEPCDSLSIVTTFLSLLPQEFLTKYNLYMARSSQTCLVYEASIPIEVSTMRSMTSPRHTVEHHTLVYIIPSNTPQHTGLRPTVPRRAMIELALPLVSVLVRDPPFICHLTRMYSDFRQLCCAVYE